MRWLLTFGDDSPSCGSRFRSDSQVQLFFFPHLLFQESITALSCTTSSPTTPISSPTRLPATCFLMRWVKSCITCRVTHTVGIISAHVALRHAKWVLFEVKTWLSAYLEINLFFPIRPSSNSTLRLNLLKIF